MSLSLDSLSSDNLKVPHSKVERFVASLLATVALLAHIHWLIVARISNLLYGDKELTSCLLASCVTF